MAGCVSRANIYLRFWQIATVGGGGPIDWPAHQFVTCVRQLVYRK